MVLSRSFVDSSSTVVCGGRIRGDLILNEKRLDGTHTYQGGRIGVEC